MAGDAHMRHNAMPVLIRSISQKDNHTFTINWSDGVKRDYRLNEVQKKCPCAQCVDENTGKRVVDENSIDPNVKAFLIQNVGRYAIRIKFTSGCSSGIYNFDLLRG